MNTKQSKQDDKDLTKFLSKVDEINSIIKDMKSDDVTKQKEAMKRADEKLDEKLGFDRTLINRDAYKYDSKKDEINPLSFPDQHTDQDAFLNALEADAKQRCDARKERHANANVVKDEGNTYFKQGQYERAVELYTKAVSIAKDLPTLYTNRAAALIQLGKFQDAIDDCDFSLRIDEKWVKAFTFKARALQKLKKYDKAVKTFEEIIDIDQTKTKAVKELIDGVLREKELARQEREAKAKLECGNSQAEGIAAIIASLLSRIDSTDVSGGIMLYVGGIETLKEQLRDVQSRTLFRTENGFDLFSKPGCIRRYMMKRLNKENTHHVNDMVCSVMYLCHQACLNVPENLKVFLSIPDVPDMLLSYLEWPEVQVQRAIITFIHENSLDEPSRLIVYKYMDCLRLCKLLLKPNTRKADLNSSSSASLCNFSLDLKFRVLIRTAFEKELLDLILDHMSEVGVNSYVALTHRMVFLYQLVCTDDTILTCVSMNKKFMESCYTALERCTSLFKTGLAQPCAMAEVLDILGLCLPRSDLDSVIPDKLITILIPLILKSKDKRTLARCMNIVIKAMERSENGDIVFMKEGGQAIIKQLVKFLKQSDVLNKGHSLKIFCLLGHSNPAHLKSLVSMDKGGSLLFNILKDNTDCGVLNQGQVALLLGYFTAIPGGLNPILTNNLEGDVVRQLLVVCRNSVNKMVRSNSAIALGKLAKYDQRFLFELRKHDGINILARNQCVSELA